MDMFRDGSVTLFHVRGVPLRAHWTLLLVLPYLAVALSYQFGAIASLADVEAARLVLPPIVWGAMLALGLFVSVALHELAHTLVAIRYGGRVHAITLMLVGGVSQMSHVPRRPRDEAFMAGAGPATSFALGAACGVAYGALDLGPDGRMTLFYLGAMNVSLGAFNLLPAFPMDGGRVLRALLAIRLGRARATRVATVVGKICAIALGIVAVMQLHLLLGLIALFVYSGADAESSSESVADALRTLTVTELLPHQPVVPVIPADLYLDDAARRMDELDRLELVIADPSGPIAIIRADDIPRLSGSHARWPLGLLGSRLRARFVIVSKEEPASSALEAAEEQDAPYIVVVDPPSRVVGLVAPRDISRAVKLRVARAPRAIGAVS